MKIDKADRQAYIGFVFFVSLTIIGLLTGISILLAFGYDEGTLDNTLGLLGHYSFLLFRFPTHNLIWLKPELISELFVPGLVVNIFIYSTLATYIITRYGTRKGSA